MAFQDSYDTRDLANASENFVFDAINTLMPKHPDICKCQDWMLDVAAIALNNLPPQYRAGRFSSLPRGVRSLRHQVPEKEKDMIERAKDAVEAAIEVVKKHPHH